MQLVPSIWHHITLRDCWKRLCVQYILRLQMLNKTSSAPLLEFLGGIGLSYVRDWSCWPEINQLAHMSACTWDKTVTNLHRHQLKVLEEHVYYITSVMYMYLLSSALVPSSSYTCSWLLWSGNTTLRGCWKKLCVRYILRLQMLNKIPPAPLLEFMGGCHTSGTDHLGLE